MATTRRLLRSALVLLPLSALAACDGDGSTGPSDPVVSALVKIQGDGQTAEVDSRVETDPTVRVNDQDGNAMAGVSVTFTAGGGGSVSSGTVTTDGSGQASTAWTLGTSTSAGQTLRATADGVSATFTATAVAGAPTGLERTGGNSQSAAPRSVLPQPLEVKVVDQFGNGVPEVTIDFSPTAGSVSPSQAVSDSDGRARTTMTLPALADADGPLVFLNESLERGRLTLSYEELMEASRSVTVTATGPGVGAVEFTPAVEGSSDVTWSLADGTVPPGLDLSMNGVLSGTPSQVGEFPMTIRASGQGGLEGERDYVLQVCEAPLALSPGESVAVDASAPGKCGVFLPSGADGDRYRVGVVWPSASADPSVTDVELTMSADGASAAPPVAAGPVASGSGGTAGASTVTDAGFRIPVARIRDDLRRLRVRSRVHPRLLEEGEALVRRMDFRGLLPDRSGAVAARVSGPQLSPESRTFRDALNSCSTDVRGTIEATLIAENEHVAVYQEDAQRASDPVSASAVQPMLDYYASYGKEVMDDYFGGLPDVDGNGKFFVVIAPFDSSISSDAAAFVLTIDTFSAERCPASNEAEVTYFDKDVVKSVGTGDSYQALPTLVHEAKHIVSLYNRDQHGSFHPTWVEEGTAEVASEVSSRIAWEAAGGPSRTDRITRQDFLDAEGFTQENWGVVLRMVRTVNTLSSQPNALTSNPSEAPDAHDFYGSSWHFFRYLADGYAVGGQSDADFFRDQNAADSQPGTVFLETATGDDMEAILEGYALAAMVNGMGQVAEAGPERTFVRYDFTSATDIFCLPNPVGTYPWPVTTTGTRSQGNCSEGGFGEEEYDLATTFGDRSYEGQVGRGGFRVHDLRSSGTGQGVEVNVNAFDPGVRVVVVRVR